MATKRIRSPFQSGTEFLVFLFTSDWIKGRKGFSALPRTNDSTEWTESQRKTVIEAREAFPDDKWLKIFSNSDSEESLEKSLIEYYKSRLQKWFRFVIPLPFSRATPSSS